MTHVKSNSLTEDEVARRVETLPSAASRARARWFLDLYWPIHQAWQERLRADESVDFEDMLVTAAEHLECGRATADFDLVLVDEFQDVSRARARLVRALLNGPNRYLLAVGDDWQSINRFAGADVSLMTDFDRWFGKGVALPLQTTFRCTQAICDVSSNFVSKNPRQMRKAVRSHQSERGEPVLLASAESREAIPDVIAAYLGEIATQVRSGALERFGAGAVTVDVLGRYQHDRDLVPTVVPPEITCTFRTIHSSKGLEADFVVIANAMNGRYGFPSQIEDDPILSLAMVDPDDFPHSEERRLMYVALTRARRQVLITTVRGHESPFIAELLAEEAIAEHGATNDVPPPRACPTCQQGVLTVRRGRYGEFYGCNRFPACRHTEKAL